MADLRQLTTIYDIFCPISFLPSLSSLKSQRFLRFAIAIPIADPRNCSDFRDKRKQCCTTIQRCDGKSLAICDFGLRLSPKPLNSFCGISGDLAPSTERSLAIAIVRFWCAKSRPFWIRRLSPQKLALRASGCFLEKSCIDLFMDVFRGVVSHHGGRV